MWRRSMKNSMEGYSRGKTTSFSKMDGHTSRVEYCRSLFTCELQYWKLGNCFAHGAQAVVATWEEYRCVT